MSHIVEITGWERGMQKVSCTEVLRDNLGVGLGDAKRLTDKILAGSKVQVSVESESAVRSLVRGLSSIGVSASAR